MITLRTIPRPLVVAAICLGALILAYQVVMIGVAGIALRDNKAAVALAIWPDYAAAAAQRAENLVGEGEPRRAQALAIRALGYSIQDSQALRTIAMAGEAQNDPAVAELGMVLAARLGWRDGFAQSWLMERALAQGEAVAAAQAADALLRTNFQRQRAEIGLQRLMTQPAGREALAERMSARPYWASPFLSGFRARRDEDGARFGHLLAELNERGARPTSKEVEGFFISLTARGAFEQAVAIWRSLNPQATGDPTKGLIDGSFSELAKGTGPWGPFGWRTRESGRVSVAIESRNEFADDPSLKVTLDGSRNGQPISQYLALRPGNYVLRYSAQLERGAAYGFRWELRCLGPRKSETSRPALASAGPAWGQQTVGLNVPADCNAQSLSLGVGSSSPEPAVARFDDLTLTRQ